ncbi:hypothetical protein EDB85DRAFT_2274255, partial [Lactarius pseudohatsudake]
MQNRHVAVTPPKRKVCNHSLTRFSQSSRRKNPEVAFLSRRFVEMILLDDAGVPIEQLRPDPTYVQLILGAVYDIRICQEIFDGWAAQLDKLRQASYQEIEERERVLRHHLTLLREDVSWCSRATDAILLCHAQFTYLMAQRIDDASRSWLKGLKYGQDTTRLTNDFVSALEKVEAQKKSSTARRILGWLEYFFNAPASIFALGSFVSPFLHSVAPGLSLIAPAASTLWKAAATRHPKYAQGKNRRASSPCSYYHLTWYAKWRRIAKHTFLRD